MGAKSLEIMKLVLFQLAFGGVIVQSLPCHTANGDSCPPVLCPNTVVNYTCNIPSGTGAGYTDWVLPTGTCPTNPFPDKIRLSQYVSSQCSAQGKDMGDTADTCGPYRAYDPPSSDPTYCLSSILTVNITSTMNCSTVTCYNTNIRNSSITTVISMATINVVAPPCVPTLLVNTTDPDSPLVIVNSSSSGGRPTRYRVTISNSSYINTISVDADPNGSKVTNFTGLTNTSLYNVSVVAINCAGSSNAITKEVPCYAVAPSSTNPALEEDTAGSVTIRTVIECVIPVMGGGVIAVIGLMVVIGVIRGGAVIGRIGAVIGRIGAVIGLMVVIGVIGLMVVIGAVIVLMVVIGVVVFCICKRKPKQQKSLKIAEEGTKDLDGLSSTPKVPPSLEESSLPSRGHKPLPQKTYRAEPRDDSSGCELKIPRQFQASFTASTEKDGASTSTNYDHSIEILTSTFQGTIKDVSGTEKDYVHVTGPMLANGHGASS